MEWKITGLYGYTNIAKITKPSLTISARGTIGYCEIRKETFYPIVRLLVATPKTKLVMIEFIYHRIQQIEIASTGNSIPQLTIPMLKRISIPIPPVSQQKAIVAKLDSLSSKTKQLEANYKSTLQNLEELKKSILQNAFNGKL